MKHFTFTSVKQQLSITKFLLKENIQKICRKINLAMTTLEISFFLISTTLEISFDQQSALVRTLYTVIAHFILNVKQENN